MGCGSLYSAPLRLQIDPENANAAGLDASGWSLCRFCQRAQTEDCFSQLILMIFTAFGDVYSTFQVKETPHKTVPANLLDIWLTIKSS